MKTSDVAELLALCAAYDQRTLGEVDVRAWAPLLANIDATDAVAAVQGWYAEHRERITPADIRKAVRAVRQERIEKAAPTDPPPEVAAGGVQAYIEWLRSDRQGKASADGPALPPAPGSLPRAELESRFGGLMRDVPGRRRPA